MRRVTNRRGATRTFSYDGDQQDHSESTTAQVTDGRGGAWRYALDLRDRPVDITDPLGTRTHLEWDSDNNVIGLTEAAGSEDEATTDYAYNQNGLLTSQTDPLGRTTYLRYRDTAGMHRSQYTSVESTLEQSIDTDADAFVSDLVAIRRPAGNEWTFELEPDVASDQTATTNGNVTAEIDPLDNRTEATYNPNGTLSSETDAVDNTATYSDYDPNGMPQVVVDPRGNSGEEPASEHRWLYRYDAVGNTTHVTDPRGSAGHVAGESIPPTFTTTLTYDALDRLTRERIPKDSRDGEFVTRSYEYDANDNQTARVDGEARRWTSTYTPMDRIASESTPLSERTTYAYDAEEGLTEIVAPRGTATALDGDHTTRFRLDGIGRRLATIRQSTEDQPLITSYAHDRRDNVTGVAYPRNNTTALGEAVSVSQALANASQPGSQRLAMSYDDANQLVAQVEDPGGLALRTEHRYDQNGNLREVLGPRGFVEGPDPAAFAQITDYDAPDPTTAVDPPNEKRETATADRHEASNTPSVRLPPGRSFATGPTIGRVVIPAIGVRAPMIGLGLNPDESLKVPGDPNKTGWWRRGARPGERGAAVIVGHVDSLTGPAVFHDLRRLSNGDKVIVFNEDGSRAAFVVTGRERVPKNRFPTDRVYDDTSAPTIRLITCGGEFNDARGHYRDNVIVYGRKA